MWCHGCLMLVPCCWVFATTRSWLTIFFVVNKDHSHSHERLWDFVIHSLPRHDVQRDHVPVHRHLVVVGGCQHTAGLCHYLRGAVSIKTSLSLRSIWIHPEYMCCLLGMLQIWQCFQVANSCLLQCLFSGVDICKYNIIKTISKQMQKCCNVLQWMIIGSKMHLFIFSWLSKVWAYFQSCVDPFNCAIWNIFLQSQPVYRSSVRNYAWG